MIEDDPMSDDSYGKILTLNENVKYIGEGQDPAKDPAFLIWKKALQDAKDEICEENVKTEQ